MWSASLADAQAAVASFPPGLLELKHTLLYCEQCSSLSFPASQQRLTTRTPNCPFTSHPHGTFLRGSHYQRHMTHVQGCPRGGMPLTLLAVTLTPSEMAFLVERLPLCPAVRPYQSRPLYVPRRQRSADVSNPLTQVCLTLLSRVMVTFDPSSQPSEATTTFMTQVCEWSLLVKTPLLLLVLCLPVLCVKTMTVFTFFSPSPLEIQRG